MSNVAVAAPAAVRAIRLVETRISGCFELHFPVHQDERGVFTKCYQDSVLAEHGLETGFKESFYTTSRENVLRGMHLQLPPADHAKLIYCVSGSVADAVLDVRPGSPTFGEHAFFELDAGYGRALYLARGIAHGFYVLRAPATMMYHVTTEYVPGLDAGVAWNSFGARWPVSDPIISDRDASLPRFQDFDNPFGGPKR